MSHNHAFKIDKLRNDFENIITLKREISKVKTLVSNKITQLKAVYNDMIKTNHKKIFLFCLDSFFFQYKTFAMEIEHIDRYRALLNNRMYCDFYKLHNIVVAYIRDNRPELNVDELDSKTFPHYKDLEPFQEYKLDDIKDIHMNILQLINRIYDKCSANDDEIDSYNEKNVIGFSISNFLNTLGYENQLLRDQVNLFVNYISFFHIAQRKQLNRLCNRLQEFYKEVEDNIHINRTFSIDDIGEQDRLHKFFIIGDDITIETMLEDTDFLMENTVKVLNKVDKILDDSTIVNNVTTEVVVNDNQPINTLSIEQQVYAIYSMHNPSKIKDIPALLDMYKGKDDEMFSILNEKYKNNNEQK